MRIVSAQELENWLASGEILEKDARGPKVITLPNGEFLKIFYTRKHPLLARLRPPAQRFAEHASRLNKLGIQTPQVREQLWIDRGKAISACLYAPLQGRSLDRLYCNARDQFDSLLPNLAAYIYQLHRRGIYFRSLHLGNILLTPNDGFGLIDFLDIRFKGGPLGRTLVRRNFRHLQSYIHRSKLRDFPWSQLLAAYDAAGRSSKVMKQGGQN